MEFSVMERNWDRFQLGTGSYTVFNYCSNSLRYNRLSSSPCPSPSLKTCVGPGVNMNISCGFSL